MERGFSTQVKGLAFKRKKAPSSRLTERRQEEMYFR